MWGNKKVEVWKCLQSEKRDTDGIGVGHRIGCVHV